MISKSSFVRFIHCDKDLWLYFNKPDKATPIDEIGLKNISDGNRVGELARSYFEDTVSSAIVDENNKPKCKDQADLTNKLLKDNHNCVAEASFFYNDLFCAVDLLKKDEEGYSIYEVKSSTSIQIHQLVDVSFQRYVLEKNGLKINHIYILHPNKEYIRQGEIDLSKYFIAECVDNNETVLDIQNNIDSLLTSLYACTNNKNEPTTQYAQKCKGCCFYDYCHKDIPKDNISILNGLRGIEDYYAKGIFSIEDYLKTNPKLKDNLRNVQIEAYKTKQKLIINNKELSKFLSTIKYPLYYLDFETTCDVIPQLEGLKPNEQYPFQYSLHIEYEDERVEHKEFLGEDLDCTRVLAEQLVNDIPLNSCSIAYNNSVEKRFIKYLAAKYPDLSEKLLSIDKGMLDLMLPFKKGYCYNVNQNGSCSIKEVMPALCPQLANAYHDLPGVHNGSEAQVAFPKLISIKNNSLEYLKMRSSMLKYCELDTLSMVEILKTLKKLCSF